MATNAQDVLARQIKRSVALGVVGSFVLTVLICLPADIGWGEAAMVAIVPAGFAGPFFGGFVFVVSWVFAEERKATNQCPAVAQVPVVSSSGSEGVTGAIAGRGADLATA